MREFLAAASLLVGVIEFVPYARDIVKGRAVPSRATRIMFAVLMVIALVQQRSLGSGFALALTLGEGIGSVLILALSLRKGMGGLRTLDLICYSLLVVDVIIWFSSHSPLVALHLTILADLIAAWPTLHKTWHNPKSETPLFFWGGVAAPLLALAAEADLSYRVVIFPLYITLINAVMLALIYRKPSNVRYHGDTRRDNNESDQISAELFID